MAMIVLRLIVSAKEYVTSNSKKIGIHHWMAYYETVPGSG
jgi:hypothetical protein